MNNIKKQKFTGRGAELLRVLANQGFRIFSLEQARLAGETLHLEPSYIPEVLSHLKRLGWIDGLKRELYAFSPDSGISEPPHEFEMAQKLVLGSVISYWTAMRFYELTQQVPNSIQSMVLEGISVPRKLHLKGFQYVYVKKECFFGFQKIWIGSAKVSITDLERTLLEGLRNPKYCGGFSEVLAAFESSLPSLDISKLTSYSLKLEEAVAKRLGWVLEQLGVDLELLRPLLDITMRGPRKLDASREARGKFIRKWQLQDNR